MVKALSLENALDVRLHITSMTFSVDQYYNFEVMLSCLDVNLNSLRHIYELE